MINETTLKIATAAFFHDIGKFADRHVMEIEQDYIDRHESIYLPSYNGRYSHYHAIYSCAFIENFKNYLPSQFNHPEWGDGDTFINLVAGHHRPETPFQWVIAIADRISSGWDRDTFESEYNKKIPVKNYLNTRLFSLFEQILGDENSFNTSDDFQYCYPLKALSPEEIFPHNRDKVIPLDRDSAIQEYRLLFSDFIDSLSKLRHRDENINLWFEHFDSLMMIYTSHIPSARVGDILPDISLYDHLRSTSAIASALYLFHKHNDSLNIDSILDYDLKKFIILTVDFYGIQDFIFKTFGDTRKLRSKLLRGRSFFISLLSELGADLINKYLGLPHSSILLNAAGKFTIIAPNTEEALRAISKAEYEINDWLFKMTYGETSMGFCKVSASPNDFVKGNFQKLWQNISKVLEQKKFSKINMNNYGGAITGYLDDFYNDLRHPLCPLCGKRPSDPRSEGSHYLGDIISACSLCRDQIFIGTNIVKKNRLAILTPDAQIYEKEDSLLEPIFGKYQLAFLEGALRNLAKDRKLIKQWEIIRWPTDKLFSEISLKFINGYVPTYSDEDNKDDRILWGEKSEEKKWDAIEQIEKGSPKTFFHIASKALNPTDKEGVYCGLEALGIFKADVDNLGVIMGCGLKEERFTLSRLATLSRQLDLFFSCFLPNFIASHREFRDIYTVFAGGDDLFLIGPWNRIVEFAPLLNNRFNEYVCFNPNIHLSAGIVLCKPHQPIDTVSNLVENSLEKSKGGDKNQITLFSETIPWDNFKKITEIKRKIYNWMKSGWLTRSMLYKFNTLIDMAHYERKLLKMGKITIDDIEYSKWRAYLSYLIERNFARDKTKDKRLDIIKDTIESIYIWLEEWKGVFKIAIWDILYNIRGGKI